MYSKILVVDDDASHRLMLEAVLKGEGFDITQADSGQRAVDVVKDQFFDLILMDIRMNRMGGIEAMKEIKKLSPGIPVIIMTAYASINTAVDALKSGASDYLTKPLDIEELKRLVQITLHQQQIEEADELIIHYDKEKFDFSNIIGKSPSMKMMFETISLVAPTDATVLVTGESGTGKELIANAIHENSRRRDKTLVKVNCAALPETLLESELFGHEKGSFTGATTPKPGRFRAAHEGTIFLDEITEMSSSTQPKLLRVLQEGEINPIGSSKSISVDTRIIAATNRDLTKEIERGNFREDLYYRLNVVTINVPPLRERREDILLLIDFFLERYNRKNQKLVKGLNSRSMDIFMRYGWPGNVRELENMIERAVILTRGDMITEKVLPASFITAEIPPGATEYNYTIGMSLKEVEKEMIIRTLENTGGNRTRAAEILGISRRTLQIKLKEYGINE